MERKSVLLDIYLLFTIWQLLKPMALMIRFALKYSKPILVCFLTYILCLYDIDAMNDISYNNIKTCNSIRVL